MLSDSKKYIAKAKLKYKLRDYEEAKKLLEQALDYVADKTELDYILALSEEVQQDFEAWEAKNNAQFEREDEVYRSLSGLIEHSVEKHMQTFCSDLQSFTATIRVQKSDPLQLTAFATVGSGTFADSTFSKTAKEGWNAGLIYSKTFYGYGIYKFDVKLSKFNGKRNSFCLGYFQGSPKFSSVNFLEGILGINYNFKLKNKGGKLREGSTVTCVLDYEVSQFELLVDGHSISKSTLSAKAHYKFGIFSHSPANVFVITKFEHITLKDSTSPKLLPLGPTHANPLFSQMSPMDLEDWTWDAQVSTFQDRTFAKENGADDWDQLYKYNTFLHSSNSYSFTLTVTRVNADTSGLVLGLFNDSHSAASLDFINAHVLGINCCDGYNYKTTSLAHYATTPGTTFTVQVDFAADAVHFLVNGVLVRQAAHQLRTLHHYDPDSPTQLKFGIFNFYKLNRIAVTEILVKRNHVDQELDTLSIYDIFEEKNSDPKTGEEHEPEMDSYLFAKYQGLGLTTSLLPKEDWDYKDAEYVEGVFTKTCLDGWNAVYSYGREAFKDSSLQQGLLAVRLEVDSLNLGDRSGLAIGLYNPKGLSDLHFGFKDSIGMNSSKKYLYKCSLLQDYTVSNGTLIEVLINFKEENVEFWVDSNLVLASTHPISSLLNDQDSYSDLRLGIFNYHKSNIIKLVQCKKILFNTTQSLPDSNQSSNNNINETKLLKNNLINTLNVQPKDAIKWSIPIAKENWTYDAGSSFTDLIFQKSTLNGWNQCYIYNKVITDHILIFKFKILNVASIDKSGLVFGLFNNNGGDKNDSLKSHDYFPVTIGMNTNDDYTYNCNKITNYDVEIGDTVMAYIDASQELVQFYRNDELVLESQNKFNSIKNLNKSKLQFGIFNYYKESRIQVQHVSEYLWKSSESVQNQESSEISQAILLETEKKTDLDSAISKTIVEEEKMRDEILSSSFNESKVKETQRKQDYNDAIAQHKTLKNEILQSHQELTDTIQQQTDLKNYILQSHVSLSQNDSEAIKDDKVRTNDIKSKNVESNLPYNLISIDSNIPKEIDIIYESKINKSNEVNYDLTDSISFAKEYMLYNAVCKYDKCVLTAISENWEILSHMKLNIGKEYNVFSFYVEKINADTSGLVFGAFKLNDLYENESKTSHFIDFSKIVGMSCNPQYLYRCELKQTYKVEAKSEVKVLIDPYLNSINFFLDGTHILTGTLKDFEMTNLYFGYFNFYKSNQIRVNIPTDAICYHSKLNSNLILDQPKTAKILHNPTTVNILDNPNIQKEIQFDLKGNVYKSIQFKENIGQYPIMINIRNKSNKNILKFITLKNVYINQKYYITFSDLDQLKIFKYDIDNQRYSMNFIDLQEYSKCNIYLQLMTSNNDLVKISDNRHNIFGGSLKQYTEALVDSSQEDAYIVKNSTNTLIFEDFISANYAIAQFNNSSKTNQAFSSYNFNIKFEINKINNCLDLLIVFESEIFFDDLYTYGDSLPFDEMVGISGSSDRIYNGKSIADFKLKKGDIIEVAHDYDLMKLVYSLNSKPIAEFSTNKMIGNWVLKILGINGSQINYDI